MAIVTMTQNVWCVDVYRTDCGCHSHLHKINAKPFARHTVDMVGALPPNGMSSFPSTTNLSARESVKIYF